MKHLSVTYPSRMHPEAQLAQAVSVKFALRAGLTTNPKIAESKIAYLNAYTMPDVATEALVKAAKWTTWFCLLDDVIESRTWEVGELGCWLTTDGPFYRALDECQICSEDTLAELLASFQWEESNRRFGLTPSFAQYDRMRRITVGVRPLLEFVGVTDYVLPALAIGYANDICTWEREKAAGETHNLVHIVGMEKALEEHNCCVDMVLTGTCNVSKQFVRGHLDWARMTGRYKGDYQP